MRTIQLFFLFFILALNSYSLPRCEGSDTEWNNCIGKKIYELEYNLGVGIYNGEWKNGKMHGHGRFTWREVGDEYVGEFKDGGRSGFGHYSFRGGSSYTGEGKIIEGYSYYHGKGTYTYRDGGRRVGYWKKDFLVKGIDMARGYSGELSGGREHGIGTMTYSWGAKYEGKWKNGERHGAGTYTAADGRKFTGEWKDDERFNNKLYLSKGSNCLPTDDRIGRSLLGSNKTAQEAYDFGLKLQSLVRAKDIKGLFDLVPGEIYGPRKSFVKNKSFDEIFSKEWVEAVLSSTPECRPVGWRGYMLAHGKIWFQPSAGEGFHISGINGAKQEEDLSTTGWTNNEMLIHPSCFIQVWLSGDNFEEYAEQFNLDYDEFSKSPGKFFGLEIDNYKPIKASWGDNVDLIKPLNVCTPKDFKLKYSAKKSNFNEKPIRVDINESQDSRYSISYYSYSTIQKFDIKKCTKLAPNIGHKCIGSYLVNVISGPGGSGGPQSDYGIYGLFDLPDLGLSIVPLKFFYNRNFALNYLDN
jgi:hypothetical protein|tara:strand:- start:35 stop:1606 length:1572 start_codon:yes stop_codon:yes gene_type:complete